MNFVKKITKLYSLSQSDEFAYKLNSILKTKIKVKIGPRRSGDSQKLISNIDKFYNLFKWKPKFNDIKKILDTAVKWEKKFK